MIEFCVILYFALECLTFKIISNTKVGREAIAHQPPLWIRACNILHQINRVRRCVSIIKGLSRAKMTRSLHFYSVPTGKRLLNAKYSSKLLSLVSDHWKKTYTYSFYKKPPNESSTQFLLTLCQIQYSKDSRIQISFINHQKIYNNFLKFV